jgi:crotonobetainyl-CoA:carnitine CoA-transferase CaiB-like acyl-CoA transferase
VPLLDSALAGLVNVAQGALVTGEEPGRYGNAHPSIVPYQDLATADGPVVVAAPNDGLFGALCREIGAPELADDERFATNAHRVRNRDALIPLLEDRLASAGADEWVERLGAAGVPVGKIRTIPDALATAAAAGRAATVSVDHPLVGPLDLIGPPARGRLRPATAPPLLGEHTREVLNELGRSDAEIDELAERGVVALGVK